MTKKPFDSGALAAEDQVTMLTRRLWVLTAVTLAVIVVASVVFGFWMARQFSHVSGEINRNFSHGQTNTALLKQILSLLEGLVAR